MVSSCSMQAKQARQQQHSTFPTVLCRPGHTGGHTLVAADYEAVTIGPFGRH